MSNWTKVTDGLPEFETLVLARRVTNDTQEAHYEGMKCYESDFEDGTPYWLYASDGELAENVTHWTPLVEPEA